MTPPTEGAPHAALTGNESFTDAGAALPITVMDYWRWGESDLLDRSQHAHIAEFLVACAVGATGTPFGTEWPYKIRDPRGISIVVSTHSDVYDFDHYTQPPPTFYMYPDRVPAIHQEPHSPEALGRDVVYVFARLLDTTPETATPLDVAHWEMYVVPTWLLAQQWPGAEEVSLEALKATPYGVAVPIEELADAVAERVAHRAPDPGAVDPNEAPLSAAPSGRQVKFTEQVSPRSAKVPLTGDEEFTYSGRPLPLTVVDMWRWRSSHLAAPSQAHQLMSFLVEKARGAPKKEWLGTGHVYTWGSRGVQTELNVRVVEAPWQDVDPATLELWCPPDRVPVRFPGSPLIRLPHLYIFALLTNRAGEALNPLELTQWDIYVVPTGFLDERWPTSRFVRLVDLWATPYGEPIQYGSLADVVAERALHFPVRPARTEAYIQTIHADAALLLAHADAVGLDFQPESLRGWDHMGAVIVDAVFKSRQSYPDLVRPRVLKVKHDWPGAVTTSGLLARLDSVDLAEFLDFPDAIFETEVPRVRVLAQLFRELGIETVEDLRQVLSSEGPEEAFRTALAPAYTGTVPNVFSFKMLVGLAGDPDEELMSNFGEEAGFDFASYAHPEDVVNAAAELRGVEAESIYSAIWAYDGRAGL